jgi:hypothetical protein
MNATLSQTQRLIAFGGACIVTLALLMGVNTMSTTDTAPVWIAKAAATQHHA